MSKELTKRDATTPADDSAFQDLPTAADSRVDADAPDAVVGGALVQDTGVMGTQYQALQEAMQLESSKFQSLVNASRARQDAANGGIENTR